NNYQVHRLYGALSGREQDEAISAPKDGNKKIVLASAIAETSLTIEGVNTVIDSGLARQPIFEPGSGLTRLQTVRAPLASVTQRSGRAGRLEPGKAIRLWREEQTAGLPKHIAPEILNADLGRLVLDLADWGVRDSSQLKWLDCPPPPALIEAEKLLETLGALDRGKLTSHGRAMGQLGLPPRFAHMVLIAGKHAKASAKRAALLALLVQERGVGGRSTDLVDRYERAHNRSDNRAKNLIKLASRLAEKTVAVKGIQEPLNHGVLLAYAFPDRIAQNRGQAADGAYRFRLANGRGAQIDAIDSLAREEFLVVVEMAGQASSARILSAANLSKSELLENFGAQITEKTTVGFDPKTGKLEAVRAVTYGSIALGKTAKVKVEPEAAQAAILQGIQEYGQKLGQQNGLSILPWRAEDHKLRQQLALLHKHFPERWPDVSDQALLGKLELGLAPFLEGEQNLQCLGKGALKDGLMLLAGHPSNRELNALTPSHFKAPSGSLVPLEYVEGKPILRIRPQELFGLDKHPHILSGGLAIDIELLSPAGRPIQITKDLSGFWRGTWADVRREMRGRYPKHPWPEDPLSAAATRRVKPKKTRK
ncbi:MAG: ATP-dependent helicase HrpB, partial [Rhizobiaceae bacterium]